MIPKNGSILFTASSIVAAEEDVPENKGAQSKTYEGIHIFIVKYILKNFLNLYFQSKIMPMRALIR